jgi:hypothetical protein
MFALTNFKVPTTGSSIATGTLAFELLSDEFQDLRSQLSGKQKWRVASRDSGSGNERSGRSPAIPGRAMREAGGFSRFRVGK